MELHGFASTDLKRKDGPGPFPQKGSKAGLAQGSGNQLSHQTRALPLELAQTGPPPQHPVATWVREINVRGDFSVFGSGAGTSRWSLAGICEVVFELDGDTLSRFLPNNPSYPQSRR